MSTREAIDLLKAEQLSMFGGGGGAGAQKAGHKYVRRSGTPGHYAYEYAPAPGADAAVGNAADGSHEAATYAQRAKEAVIATHNARDLDAAPVKQSAMSNHHEAAASAHRRAARVAEAIGANDEWALHTEAAGEHRDRGDAWQADLSARNEARDKRLAAAKKTAPGSVVDAARAHANDLTATAERIGGAANKRTNAAAHKLAADAHDKAAAAHVSGEQATKHRDAAKHHRDEAAGFEHLRAEKKAAKSHDDAAADAADKIPGRVPEAKAPPAKKTSQGFDSAVKRYGGNGMSPASIEATKASERAQKEGTREAHMDASNAHHKAASFHDSPRTKPEHADSEVSNHHYEAADAHSKIAHNMGGPAIHVGESKITSTVDDPIGDAKKPKPKSLLREDHEKGMARIADRDARFAKKAAKAAVTHASRTHDAAEAKEAAQDDAGGGYAAAKARADKASAAVAEAHGHGPQGRTRPPPSRKENMQLHQEAHTAHVEASKAAFAEGKRTEGEQHKYDSMGHLPDDVAQAHRMMRGGYAPKVKKSDTEESDMAKSTTFEGGILRSQDRTAGPPAPAGVYDGLASGMVDPTIDRPRWIRGPQVLGVGPGALGVIEEDPNASTFAFQKSRQVGGTLELAKSAVIAAVKDGYRMQLMALADGDTVGKLVTRHARPGERPTLPIELRKSVQTGAPDPEAVVAFAAAALTSASDRNPQLREGLSRLGVSRRTLKDTLEALALTPARVTAGV